jgi:hypothetical protein
MCACTGVWVQACVLAQGFLRKHVCLHKAFGASMCACTRLLAQACVQDSGKTKDGPFYEAKRKAKDGPFYEAKRKNKGWTIL